MSEDKKKSVATDTTVKLSVYGVRGRAPRQRSAKDGNYQMPVILEFPTTGDSPLNSKLSVKLDRGECIFVLGPNGSGKSSLMHAIYGVNKGIARRITAHRQTWFSSGALNLTAEQKRQTEQSMQSIDAQAEARWKDDYSAQRANIAIYELIDAENVRAREIAAAVDANDMAKVGELRKKVSPITTINELLKLSSIPISISVHQNEQLMASKSGSAPYSVAELSDGERNALLIGANVLTAPAGTLLLIDEPERHLHRSIISPLLTLLFAKRQDCAFVVSTHDVLLPLDNPSARTLLVRGCTYGSNRAVTEWDLDLLPANAPVDDELKADILGARRKVLFVEGDEKSLDKPLYSLVFPEVSVVAKGGCVDVETGVSGIRGAPDVHWVRPYGIVDNDRRSSAEVARLLARGVYATAVHSVESIYYHPNIQRQVAERHAGVTGADAPRLLARAQAAAIALITQQDIERLSARAIEKEIHETIHRQKPGQSQIVQGQAVSISVDVKALLSDEISTFQQLVAKQDLEAIISRYPIRETPVLAKLVQELGFKDRGQYEGAVRKLLMDVPDALKFVRSLFGTLYADMTS